MVCFQFGTGNAFVPLLVLIRTPVLMKTYQRLKFLFAALVLASAASAHGAMIPSARELLNNKFLAAVPVPDTGGSLLMLVSGVFAVIALKKFAKKR